MFEIIAMIASLQMASLDRQEVFCVAQAVYHEARGEPLAGRVAVANVIKNRMELERTSACAVVHRAGQFSFLQESDLTIRELDAWRNAVEVAALVYADVIPDQTGGATHYYDRRLVRPRWASLLRQTRVIAGHRLMKQ